jgi:hypothetical protein
MGVLVLAGCQEGLADNFAGPEEPLVLQDSEKKLDISICAPNGNFSDPLTSKNPYFPVEPVGAQWTLEGEEDGAAVKVVVTVLNRTRTIDGVDTRVIEEREFESEEGEELEEVEISWNYFAHADDGTACYYGEDVDIFEDEDILHDGAWCAEDAPNEPGIFMPADPQPGMKFLQESAPGIALDGAKMVGIGPVTVPYGTFAQTVRFREFDGIEGTKGDYKVFAMDDFGAGDFQGGTVIDGPLQLTDYSVGDGEPESEISVQHCGS